MITNRGSEIRDQGSGISDQGSGIRDQSAGIRDQGAGKQHMRRVHDQQQCRGKHGDATHGQGRGPRSDTLS